MQLTHFFFDVDSTVISHESLTDVVQEAADGANLQHKLTEITDAGMNGEIDFQESLKRRIGLAIIQQKHIDLIASRMPDEITKGMPEFMNDLRKAGHDVWLLTAGLKEMMLPLAKKLGIPADHVLANEPLWTNGRLTGFQPGPLLHTEGKAKLVEQMKRDGILKEKIIMIGDGASDLTVFTAGVADDFFGFGEHAVRPNVLELAPHFFKSVAEIRAYLSL